MSLIQIQGHSIESRFLNQTSTVLDLGANHGAFSQQMVERFRCRVIAVEANSSLADKIQRLGSFEVVNACVGGGDGMVELAIAENDQCSSMLMPQTSAILRREIVPMRSLPGLLAQFQVKRVDLLKMDIEGAEVQVLDAIPDIEFQRVAQLTVEFHDSLGMTSLEEIRRITHRLEALGFVWIRGSFWNFEDNLFLNRALCPMTDLEVWFSRNVMRTWNGVTRIARRRWSAFRARLAN